MFDPARLRVNLPELLLRTRNGFCPTIVNNGAAAARTLVYRQQVLLRHFNVTPSTEKGLIRHI
jgi:hypothetical protein